MRIMKPDFVLGLIGIVFMNPSLAWAESSAEAGSVKFETCAGCHSHPGYANAVPRFQVPKLAGQQLGYLIHSLKAYSNGERGHPGMRGNAKGLSDRDIEDIATYLASFKQNTNDNHFSGNAKLGEQKAAGCIGCHGKGGNSSDENFPRLAGQYQSYLIKVLMDYKLKKRNNPVMAGMAAALSDEDIENISAFYASQTTGLSIVNR